MKCTTHNKAMIKVGRGDFICYECNGMTKEELINHLIKNGEIKNR